MTTDPPQSAPSNPPTPAEVYRWNVQAFGEGVTQNYALVIVEEIAEVVDAVGQYHAGRLARPEFVKALSKEAGDVAITLLCLWGREFGLANLQVPTTLAPRTAVLRPMHESLTLRGGMIARAVLKREQGIRMAPENWTRALQRQLTGAMRDLARLATHHGVELAPAVAARWAVVSTRDASAPRPDDAPTVRDEHEGAPTRLPTTGLPVAEVSSPAEVDAPRPARSALYEQLASIQHDIWAHWMRYLLGECVEVHDDGSATVTAERVAAWWRQIDTAYAGLTEAERSSDREQVDRFWPWIAHAEQRAPGSAVADAGPFVRTEPEVIPGQGEPVVLQARQSVRLHHRDAPHMVDVYWSGPSVVLSMGAGGEVYGRMAPPDESGARTQAWVFEAERDAARANLANVAEALGWDRVLRDEARGDWAARLERHARLIFRQHQAQQADESRWGVELEGLRSQLMDLEAAVRASTGCEPGEEQAAVGAAKGWRDEAQGFERVRTLVRDRMRVDGFEVDDDAGLVTMFEVLRAKADAGLAQHVIDALAAPADDGISAREVASRTGRRMADLHGQVDGMRDRLCRAVGVPLISDDGPDARWARAVELARKHYPENAQGNADREQVAAVAGRLGLPPYPRYDDLMNALTSVINGPVKAAEAERETEPPPRPWQVGDRVVATVPAGPAAPSGSIDWPGIVTQLGPAGPAHGILPVLPDGWVRVALDPANGLVPAPHAVARGWIDRSADEAARLLTRVEGDRG